MTDAKPIALTQVSEGSYSGPAPKPYVVVGDIPGADITPQEAPAIDDAPVDAAAVAADLQSLVDALIASGVLTEA